MRCVVDPIPPHQHAFGIDTCVKSVSRVCDSAGFFPPYVSRRYIERGHPAIANRTHVIRFVRNRDIHARIADSWLRCIRTDDKLTHYIKHYSINWRADIFRKVTLMDRIFVNDLVT